MASRKSLGFSMIDTLIAILILATGLLALAVLQGALAHNAADAQARARIAAYGEGLLETLRAAGYDAASPVAAVSPSNTCSIPAPTLGQKMQCAAYDAQNAAAVNNLKTAIDSAEYYGLAQGAWTSAKPAGYNDSFAHYKKITVTTTWTDGWGQTLSQRFDTAISPIALATDGSLDAVSFLPQNVSAPQIHTGNMPSVGLIAAGETPP